MRDFATKQDNTAPAASGILSAAEDNVRFNELKHLVSTAGISLDSTSGPDTDLYMMAQAVARYVSGAEFGVDSGAANAYVVGSIGSFKVPKALFTGMRIKFYPARDNSGATTLNAFTLGTKKLFTEAGAACAGGEIKASREVEADFDATLDGGAGAWRLTPWSNQLNQGGGGGGGGGGGVTVDARQLAKAWVRYDGVNKAILSSYNVSSVTWNAAGDYTVNFTSPFASANYVAAGLVGRTLYNSTIVATFQTSNATGAQQAGSYRVNVIWAGNINVGQTAEADDIMLVFFGT